MCREEAARIESLWRDMAVARLAIERHHDRTIGHTAAYLFALGAALALWSIGHRATTAWIAAVPLLLVLAACVDGGMAAIGRRGPGTLEDAAVKEIELLHALARTHGAPLAPGQASVWIREIDQRDAGRSWVLRVARDLRALPAIVPAAVIGLPSPWGWLAATAATTGVGALVWRRAYRVLRARPRQLAVHRELVARSLREAAVARAIAAPAEIRELADDARSELGRVEGERPDLECAIAEAIRESEALHRELRSIDAAVVKARARGIDEERIRHLESERERVRDAIGALGSLLANLHADAAWLASLSHKRSAIEALATEVELLRASADGLSRALEAVGSGGRSAS
ncbi:MAG: hypothetical protein U0166_01760 [Acidobacteriota bacterium]